MQASIQEISQAAPVVTLRGSLDSASQQPLQAEVQSLLDQGHRQIIVDCSALTFISSAGIGAMVALHRHITEAQAVLRYAGTTGPAFEVLELMNLGSILNLSPDIPHARQAFR